jgi:hypothetical protein
MHAGTPGWKLCAQLPSVCMAWQLTQHKSAHLLASGNGLYQCSSHSAGHGKQRSWHLMGPAGMHATVQAQRKTCRRIGLEAMHLRGQNQQPSLTSNTPAAPLYVDSMQAVD